MITLISLMFVLDTLLWATHVKRDMRLMVNLLDGNEEKLRDIENQHGSLRLMANSLVLINVSNITVHRASAHYLFQFAISDSVVVWRAWALAKESRLALCTCGVFLFGTFGEFSLQILPTMSHLSTVTTILVIIARIIITASPVETPSMTSFINDTQTVNLGLSLLTNLTATSLIAFKAW